MKRNQSKAVILATQDKFIENFKICRGIIGDACKMTGIDRATLFNWCRDYPDFKKRCEDVEKDQVDFVESAFLKNIEKGNVVAQIFYLKNKAKHMYADEQNINIIKPIDIQYVKPDNILPDDDYEDLSDQKLIK